MARATFTRLNRTVQKRRAITSGYRGIVAQLSAEELSTLADIFGDDDAPDTHLQDEMPAHIAAHALKRAA